MINASLAGLIEEARQHRQISRFYGAPFGLDGVLREEFLDLFAQSPATLEGIAAMPSSALGTSRLEAGPAEMEHVLEVFRKHDIRYLFYTGGNGSMGTALQMVEAARDRGYELCVIGVPKTIDNDLAETDHTPGYPTTARFFASAVRDIGADNRALPGQVEIVEVLGRNAGWLVAATSLARHRPDDAPHLIYLPEVPLPLETLLADIDRVYHRLGRCVVAVCEGQLDEHGEPFGADVREGSRGKLAMNLGHRLAMLAAQHLKLKTRSEKPGLLGRSSWGDQPAADRAESRLCGRAAVRAACEGVSGSMVTLVREPGLPYAVSTGLAPLERVAFIERLFPEAWRAPSGHDVLPEFQQYAAPLVGPLRHYELLA